MLINMIREDILALLRGGAEPPYELIDVLTAAKLGVYVGGLGDHWEWRFENESISDSILHHIYMCIKHYWKKTDPSTFTLFSLDGLKMMLMPYLPGPEQAREAMDILTEDEKMFQLALEAVRKDLRNSLEKAFGPHPN